VLSPLSVLWSKKGAMSIIIKVYYVRFEASISEGFGHFVDLLTFDSQTTAVDIFSSLKSRCGKEDNIVQLRSGFVIESHEHLSHVLKVDSILKISFYPSKVSIQKSSFWVSLSTLKSPHNSVISIPLSNSGDIASIAMFLQLQCSPNLPHLLFFIDEDGDKILIESNQDLASLIEDSNAQDPSGIVRISLHFDESMLEAEEKASPSLKGVFLSDLADNAWYWLKFSDLRGKSSFEAMNRFLNPSNNPSLLIRLFVEDFDGDWISIQNGTQFDEILVQQNCFWSQQLRIAFGAELSTKGSGPVIVWVKEDLTDVPYLPYCLSSSSDFDTLARIFSNKSSFFNMKGNQRLPVSNSAELEECFKMSSEPRLTFIRQTFSVLIYETSDESSKSEVELRNATDLETLQHFVGAAGPIFSTYGKDRVKIDSKIALQLLFLARQTPELFYTAPLESEDDLKSEAGASIILTDSEDGDEPSKPKRQPKRVVHQKKKYKPRNKNPKASSSRYADLAPTGKIEDRSAQAPVPTKRTQSKKR
jgi:hypothetical protein